MKSLHTLAVAGILTLTPMAGQAAQLLSNGGFESFIPAPGSAGYLKVGAGESTISGWTVGGNSVDLIWGGAYGSINNVSVDLLGTPGPGSISQSFTVQPGANDVTLSFDYFRNGGSPGVFSVGIDGSVMTPWVVDAAVSGVTSFSRTFSLAAGTYTLTFAASGSSTSGPVIDNVSVSAVPEPHEWALLLSGLALTGWVARRRKAG